MNFFELFRHLEQSLGYHQFPLNQQAAELSHLFDNSAAHHDFVVRLAHELYKANRCQKLRSPVTRETVEQVLAEIRAQVLDGKKTDIDLYHFIEDVCVSVNNFLLTVETPEQPRANEAG